MHIHGFTKGVKKMPPFILSKSFLCWFYLVFESVGRWDFIRLICFMIFKF